MFQLKTLYFNTEDLLSNYYVILMAALDSPIHCCRLILNNTSKEGKRGIRIQRSGSSFENQDWHLEQITHKPCLLLTHGRPRQAYQCCPKLPHRAGMRE